MPAYDIEAALRAALNGESLPTKRPTIRKNFAPPSYHHHKVTLRYSVQESWGGPFKVVEYSKNTISVDEVKLMAETEMAKARYKGVVLLDVITT